MSSVVVPRAFVVVRKFWFSASMRESNGGRAGGSGSIKSLPTPPDSPGLSGVGCQSCDGQYTSDHPPQRRNGHALRLAGKSERSEVLTVLSEQGVGLANVGLCPCDYLAGIGRG